MSDLNWIKDLQKPQEYQPIYLNESARKNLEHTLSFVTGYSNMTLSEAIEKLCNEWIEQSNLKMAIERGDLKWKKKSSNGRSRNT